jgi:EpsI family protein
MPGDGWIFSESGEAQLRLGEPDGGMMGVKRALMEKDGQRQIVYYWFPMRGRMLTGPYEIKLFTFWDALTRQRTDGALVRLVTPVYRDEKPEESEARLQAFAGKIVPILNGYLPGD